MTDKIALVTGSAQGIGYACAEALAEMGAKPILADINTEKVNQAAEQLGHSAAAYTCDVGKPEEIEALFAKIEADHGVVSTLVNNAGIALPGDFFETSLEQFQRVIDVNLTGTYVALKRAAKAMVDNHIEGSIVNMSSINAVVAIPSIAAYCASKGGVAQITKSASLALATLAGAVVYTLFK